MEEKPVTKTPSEWRALLALDPKRPLIVPDWQHEAASVLHGWPLHIHHTGNEMQLELDHYQAALDAAAHCRPPVQPARSPHAGRTR
jgi:hypothetical protein